MSIWEELEIETAVRDILGSQKPSQAHPHLGRPYLTGYQIALELNQRFPEIVKRLDKPIGGQGTDRQDSVTQYVAGELSRRIGRDQLPGIEGALLSDRHLRELSFAGNIRSSLVGAFDTSIYRLSP